MRDTKAALGVAPYRRVERTVAWSYRVVPQFWAGMCVRSILERSNHETGRLTLSVMS